MYLTSTNLIHYLLACGHLSRQAVVHTPFSVFEIDGHHRSFRVSRGTVAGLFVKQLKTSDRHSIDCLGREAACYRLAWSDPGFGAWQRLLPRFISYDPDRHVIIVQQIVDAEDLIQCHRRLGSFPLDLARLLGTALADLHTTTRGIPRGRGAAFTTRPPWLFRFHEQGQESSSEAVRQLAEDVSTDEVMSRQLADLAASWSPEVLIHGDIKWTNCLVSPQPDDTPRLHLIDWELASWGDPLWDVAGGLAQYVAEPLLHGGRYDAGRAATLEDAELLALVQPPMRSMWLAYCRRIGCEPARATELAVRCARYLGARLLLTTIEFHQHAGQPGDSLVALLAASRTLLRDPPGMAAALLGGIAT